MKRMIVLIALLLVAVQSDVIVRKLNLDQLGSTDDPSILKEYLSIDSSDLLNLQLQYDYGDYYWQLTSATADLLIVAGDLRQQSGDPQYGGYQDWNISCTNLVVCENQRVNLAYDNTYLYGESESRSLEVQINNERLSSGKLLGFCTLFFFLFAFI